MYVHYYFHHSCMRWEFVMKNDPMWVGVHKNESRWMIPGTVDPRD